MPRSLSRREGRKKKKLSKTKEGVVHAEPEREKQLALLKAARRKPRPPCKENGHF
jgi:hypothetical protein